MEHSRYRVIPTRIPGMATGDTTDTEPAPPKHTEPVDCLVGILRARRMETTRPRKGKAGQPTLIRRECLLIESDEDEDGFFEHMNLCYTENNKYKRMS